MKETLQKRLLLVLGVAGSLMVVDHWSWFPGLVACAIWWGWICLTRRTIEIPPLTITGLLFALSGLVSAIFGLDIAVSWNGVGLLFSYWALWVTAWNLGRREEIREGLQWAFLLTLAAYVVLAGRELAEWYSGWLAVRNPTYPFQPALARIWSVRNYPNDLGVFLALTIPVGLWIRERDPGWRARVASVSIASALLLLVYCRSRNAWIMVGAELAIHGILSSPTRPGVVRILRLFLPALVASLLDDALLRKPGSGFAESLAGLPASHSITPYLLLSGSALVAGALVPGVGKSWVRHPRTWAAGIATGVLAGGLALTSCLARPLPSGSLSAAFATDAGSGRSFVWWVGWKGWLEQPWFGVGPGCFARLWGRFTETSSSWLAMHAHDLPLDLLVKQGVVGLLVFAMGFFLASARLLRGCETRPGAYALQILGGVVAGFLFDTPFTSPVNMACILLLLAVQFHPTESDSRSWIPGPVGAVFVLLPFLLFEQASRNFPGLGWFDASEQSAARGQVDSALVFARRSIEAAPDNPLYLRRCALLEARAGEPIPAIRLFEASLRADSNHVATWLNLAVLRFRTGDSAGARADLAQSVHRGDAAYRGLPGLLSCRFGAGSISDSAFEAWSRTDPILLASRACVDWSPCRERLHDALGRSPEWSGVRGVPAGRFPPEQPILAYFWHDARSERIQAAWLRTWIGTSPGEPSRGWAQLATLDWLDGKADAPGKPFRVAGNSRYLQGIDSPGSELLPEIEEWASPVRFRSTGSASAPPGSGRPR